MTYGELKALFLKRLKRRDCTPSDVIEFLDEGIQRCQQELRCPANESNVIVTIGANFTGLWIPNDFLELIRLENSLGQKLIMKSLDYVKSFNYAGTPSYYARQGKLWVLGPIPVKGDTVRIDYYSEFGGLVQDSDYNIITQIAPNLIVYSALSYAAEQYEDTRAERFEARYQQILTQLNGQADNDDLSDASVQQAFSYPED